MSQVENKKTKQKLTPEMIRYICDMVERVQYGRVVIDLNEHLHSIDISVELKKRFDKPMIL